MKPITKLKEARKLSGETQAQTAAKLDMNLRSYQQYEYGTGSNTIRAAIKIANAFGTTVEALWGQDIPHNRKV